MGIDLKSLLAGMVGGKVLSSNREHPVVVVNQKEEASAPSDEEKDDDSFDIEGASGEIPTDTDNYEI